MVFGTFDLLHKGHVNFLKQAKEYGYLIVVLGTDENIEKLKGKKPVHHLQSRIKDIENLKIADEVTGGYQDNFFRIIKERNPDIICLGYDQKSFDLQNHLPDTEIIRLNPYREDKYKSSILRKD